MKAGRALAFVCCAALGAGCSGGSGSSGTSSVSPSSTAFTATFAFTVPQRTAQSTSATRRATFISPSSQSLEIDVDYGTASSVGAQLNLAPLPTTCSVTAGVTECDLAVVAQASATAFTITFFDQPNEQGNVLSTVTVPVPAAVNGVASISATLLPVVANLDLAPAAPLVPGQATTTALTFTALDADGNAITGSAPFSSPVQLTPASPAITFTPNTITSPATVVTVTYNGMAIGSTQVTAHTGTKTFTTQLAGSPTSIITPAEIGVTVGEPGAPVLVSASGSSGVVTLVSSCIAGAQISLSQSTVPVGTPTSVTVTAVSAPAGQPTHACTITATAPSESGSTFVDVNQNTATINENGRHAP